MKRWSRYTTFAMTLLMVLALCAMQVVPVLADDSTPPPTETPEVVPPPTENTEPEAAPTEPPATDVTEVAPEATPVATEVPAELQAPAPAEAAPSAAEAPAAEPETPAEILAQVPAGTEIVVLDQNGKALPLASAAAAEAISEGDPQWCPVGVAPNSPSCSGPYSSLQELVADVGVNFNPAANGVIWIENTAFTSLGSIVFDGTSSSLDSNVVTAWSTWSNYGLTFKGGWLGPGTTITSTPSTIQDSLSILDWKGDITLSDIVITGASGSGYALDIKTTKNITLTNVDVVNNATTSGGAYLNNVGGTGNVTINDSTFNGNTGTTSVDTDRVAGGLVLRSPGNVTIKNLSTYGNGGAGATVNNTAALTAKTVTLTGINNFNDNGADGLSVSTWGTITLNNVNAISNGNRGVYLDNCDYQSANGLCLHSNFATSVILKGNGNFSDNGGNGLEVYSNGSITAANLIANGNGSSDHAGYGAYLFNYGAATPKTITLTGINTFNDNAGSGLRMDAFGTVTLNNLTANNNGKGTSCAVGNCDGMHVGSAINFTLSGYGIFNNNDEDGMEINSWGVTTLNNLTANDNGLVGVQLINSFNRLSTEAVNLLGTNTFNGNGTTGLDILSEGVVTLNNITANGNNVSNTDNEYGVYINNTRRQLYNPTTGTSTWVVADKTVILKGVNTFSGNNGTGLHVFSSGTITTNAITAENNEVGVYLDNCLVDSGTGTTCWGLAGKAIVMTGNNNINLNSAIGLHVDSRGVITVNNLTASDNTGSGATLNNSWAGAVGGVNLIGYATTSRNDVAGLGIFSQGAVVASNLTAVENGPWGTMVAAAGTSYNGVVINNTFNNVLMNVTLLGTNTFSGNWDSGLKIWSYGNVLLTNITANNNGAPANDPNNLTPDGYGVYIDAQDAAVTAIKPVTLNGINTFNGNLMMGLAIWTRGAVIVNKPTANDNGGRGIYIHNQMNANTAPVTIVGYGILNSNGGTGLGIYSNGAITLNNITSNDNTGSGVYVDTKRYTQGSSTDSAAPVNVTLNGVNTFNNNTSAGLIVYTDGTILVNNLTANDNDTYGAFLDNYTRRKTGNLRNITLNGWGTFVGNTNTGLVFNATGPVSLTRITASNNSGGGVIGDSTSSITFTCGNLYSNTGAGYDLSGTVITLKGVFTYGNTSGNTATGSISTTITRTCPLP